MSNYYLMLLIFFFMDVGATFLVIFREALFLSTYPSTWLPYYYLAEMLLSLALVIFLHPIALKGYRYFNHLVVGAWVLIALIGAPLLALNIPLLPFFYALHLFTIYPIVGVSLYNLASSIFTMKDYKSYTSYFMAAGSLGIVTGSLAAEPISRYFNSTAMLGLGLFFLSAIWLGLFQLSLPKPSKIIESPIKDKIQVMSRRNILERYPIITCIFGIAIFMELTNTLAHYSFSSFLSRHYDRDEISILLSRVISITYIISFILEAFFINKLTERYGFNTLFITPPIVIILGVIFSTSVPLFVPLAIYYGAVSSLNNCFNLIGVELALNSLPPRVRMWTKLTEGGFIASLGVLIASLSLMVIQYLGLPLLQQTLLIAAITLTMCLPLLYYGSRIKKFYQEALADQIGVQRFQAQKIDDFFMQEKMLSEHVLHLKLSPFISLFSDNHSKSDSLSNSLLLNKLDGPNHSPELPALSFINPLILSKDYAKVQACIQILSSMDNETVEPVILELARHPNILVKTWNASAALTHLGIVPHSKEYQQAAYSIFFEEAEKRRLFQRTLKQPLPNFLKNEIQVQLYLASLRSLCWLMVHINYRHAKNLISLFLFHPSAQDDLFRRSNILELLHSFTDDHKIKGIISQWDDPKEEPSSQKDLELCSRESPYLQQMIAHFVTTEEKPMDELLEKIMILRQVEAFKDLASETLSSLAQEVQFKRVEKGEIIFEQGDEPNGIYIIAEGSVNFHRLSEKIVVRKAFALFGIVGIVTAKPRFTTAIAAEDSMLLYIDGSTFNDLICFFPEIQRAMLYNVIEYLQNVIEKSRPAGANLTD